MLHLQTHHQIVIRSSQFACKPADASLQRKHAYLAGSLPAGVVPDASFHGWLQSKEELVLRGFDYCIVDEVDSILIDEARTPLIISGQSDKPSNKYEMTQKLAAALERDFHYTVDEKQKNVLLTEDGYEAAEQVLNVSWLLPFILPHSSVLP